VNVRLEDPDDRPVSLAVERAAFADPVEPGIVEAVRDEEGSFALVAEADGEVVGHVQLSRAWVGASPVLALGPIGVRPDRQRAGIGSALVREALDEARRRGAVAVILLGDPAHYGRFGFVPGSRFGLRNPFAGARDDVVVEEDDLQIAVLDEVRTAALSGDVRWHRAFG
jgi:putative acetyltransferase